MEQNPYAIYAPTWTSADAARAMGFQSNNSGTARQHRRRAMDDLWRLNKDGAIDFEKLPTGAVHIFGAPRQSV